MACVHGPQHACILVDMSSMFVRRGKWRLLSHARSAPDTVQAEGLPGFSAVWPSLQGLAHATDAAEQVALAGCVARLASLPALPVAQVVETLLPLIVSRLCGPAAVDEVRVVPASFTSLFIHF